MSSKSVTQAREIKNGGDTKLVVSAGTWRKKGYVDIRNYWRSPDGEWHPTKRGVRVGEDDARSIVTAISSVLGVPASRNGRKRTKNNYGLPGPNPPRNAAGGFKVVGLGAIERLGPSGVSGASVQDRSCPESPCGHSFPTLATFIPPWVKYAVKLAQTA